MYSVVVHSSLRPLGEDCEVGRGVRRRLRRAGLWKKGWVAGEQDLRSGGRLVDPSSPSTIDYLSASAFVKFDFFQTKRRERSWWMSQQTPKGKGGFVRRSGGGFSI